MRDAATWDEWVESVSSALYETGIFHTLTKKPGHTLSLNIAGIQTFRSVRDLAATLEQAADDLTYSAASGFSLYRRTPDADA